MWRDAVSPVGAGARTRQMTKAVAGWATAESPATGCGAGHDRMTSLHSRSSQMSRWRHWIRAWGSGEPVANDPAARASDRQLRSLLQGWAGHPSHSRWLLSLTSLARVQACGRIDAVTRWASRNAAFGPSVFLLSKRRRTEFISASNKTLATVPFPSGDDRPFVKAANSCSYEWSGFVTAGDRLGRPLGLSC